MKLRLFTVSVLFVSGIANASPSVTDNTDISKRKVESHYQVTRCENGDDECKINSVTKFDKSTDEKKTYYGECTFNEVNNMRVKECVTSKTKKKESVVVEEKIVKETVYKKNRIQLHIGHGPDGLKVDENYNDTKVKERNRAVGGLQYTRSLNETINVGGSVFSNGLGTLSLGLDF